MFPPLPYPASVLPPARTPPQVACRGCRRVCEGLFRAAGLFEADLRVVPPRPKKRARNCRLCGGRFKKGPKATGPCGVSRALPSDAMACRQPYAIRGPAGTLPPLPEMGPARTPSPPGAFDPRGGKTPATASQGRRLLACIGLPYERRKDTWRARASRPWHNRQGSRRPRLPTGPLNRTAAQRAADTGTPGSPPAWSQYSP